MPPLVTVEEFFNEVGIQYDDTHAREWLEQVEPIARAAIEQRTGRYFGEIVERPWILDGNGLSRIVVPDLISTLVSVEYRNGGEWVELDDAANYYHSGFILYGDLDFPCGRGNIRVTAEIGYNDIEDISIHVRGVCRRMLARLWMTKGTSISSVDQQDMFAGIKNLVKTSDLSTIPRPWPGV